LQQLLINKTIIYETIIFIPKLFHKKIVVLRFLWKDFSMFWMKREQLQNEIDKLR